jgi:GNAT superfamily N-acetyltransferase
MAWRTVTREMFRLSLSSRSLGNALSLGHSPLVRLCWMLLRSCRYSGMGLFGSSLNWLGLEWSFGSMAAFVLCARAKVQTFGGPYHSSRPGSETQARDTDPIRHLADLRILRFPSRLTYDADMIRDAQDGDYPQIAALQNAHYDHHFDQTSQEMQRSDAQRLEQHGQRFGRIVCVQTDQVVAGLMYFMPEDLEDVFRFQLFGATEHYGMLYLDFLTRIGQFQPRAIQSVVREDMLDMPFLAHAGLINRYQSWGAHLDLTQFEFGTFAPLEERLFMDGYEIEHMAAGGNEITWKDLYVLFLETKRDTPYNPTTTLTYSDFATFRASIGDGCAFFARRKNQVVGYTLIDAEASTETMISVAHRNRGLATLLIARALDWAKAEGLREAGNGGNVLNLPLLRLQQKLGYEIEPMWSTWWLELK